MASKPLIIFLFLPFTLISSNLEVGQQCITRENESGTCANFYRCKIALINFERGIYPTLCSSYNKNVVCCTKIDNDETTFAGNRNSRPHQQKCEEYSKIAKSVSTYGGLSLGSTKLEKVESYTCELSQSLIVGGEKTKVGEFPHMAALGWRGNLDVSGISFRCGGSLISNQYVLTAAHCQYFRKREPEIVRLGDQNLRSHADNATEIDVPVEAFIRHELYNSALKKNDIALVKMRYAIRFEKNIRPACLWPSFQINTNKAVATGFGNIGYDGPSSDELQKVQLEILSSTMCDAIDNTQLCAGGVKKAGVITQGDTCPGDSGGPLQLTLDENKCTFFIIGITSYGPSYCGFAPAVYTRVSAYLDWIERKVWG